MLSPYRVLILGLVALLVALSSPAPLLAEQSQTGGINPADMDLSVDPGEDFYRFANGGWLDRTEIPSDQPAYGVAQEVYDLTQEQLLALLDELSSGSEPEEGSDEWKVVQLFTQGTDLATRNAQGKAPIEATLAEIAGINDVEGLHRFLPGSRFKGVHGFFTVDIYSDPEDSNIWAAYLGGPQLWLP